MYNTKEISANTLTKQALKILDMKGFEVWRHNQIKVPGRAFNGKKGVSDIIGFHRSTGKFIACEIKAGKDRLSIEQWDFLKDVTKSGGIAIVVKTIDDLTLLNHTTNGHTIRQQEVDELQSALIHEKEMRSKEKDDYNKRINELEIRIRQLESIQETYWR